MISKKKIKKECNLGEKTEESDLRTISSHRKQIVWGFSFSDYSEKLFFTFVLNILRYLYSSSYSFILIEYLFFPSVISTAKDVG